MAQDNTSLVKSVYEAFNKKDFDALLKLGMAQTKWVEVPFQTTFSGESAVRDAWKGWSDIFPDGKVEVRKLLSSEDCIITECIGRGTHQGVFHSPAGDLQPTGKQVEIPFCDIIRLKDGKILSVQSYFDFYTFLSQLGLETKISKAA
ncbi:MAG: hypothetical protein A2X94_10790 [Bdellovibrionales bacterium GWB1_55_8]|nr:MAG: hypothetical protein A2X94_10790 [Bdellovibrionales bacterium GWB1_55_8]